MGNITATIEGFTFGDGNDSDGIEAKAVQQIRRAREAARGSGRPFVITMVIHEESVTFFYGQPSGKVKR